MGLRKLPAVLGALLLSAAELPAQQFFAGVDFTTRFDNREYAGTHFADASETFFSARLTPQVGIRWDERNSLVVAVDLLQDFGDGAKFLTEAKPQIFYQFEAPKVRAAAGIFPREKLRGDYGEAFFDTSYLFYHNRIQGVMGQYRGRSESFVELALDWEGMQSKTAREKFRLLSAGRYDRGGAFYGGYALSLQHFAKTSDPAPDEGVVDNILVNPFVGGRFTAFFDFDIRIGYMQSLQRDRIAENGWETPKGGVLEIRLSRWGLTLGNMLYAGQNLMPLYGRYGEALYAGSVFFGTPDSIYNRTEIAYARRFFHDTLGVKAGIFFHCDGKGMGTSQLLELNVRLQKIFAGKKK